MQRTDKRATLVNPSTSKTTVSKSSTKLLRKEIVVKLRQLPSSVISSVPVDLKSFRNHFLEDMLSDSSQDNFVDNAFIKCEPISIKSEYNGFDFPEEDFTVSEVTSQNDNLEPDFSNHKESGALKHKRVTDNRNFCYFCRSEVSNFARHLLRKHSSESEVKNIISLEPKSQLRIKIITLLRRRGNYLKNINGCYKPVRKLNGSTNMLPCSNCLGFFSAKFLYRHRKRCLEKGFKYDGAQNDSDNTKVNIDELLKEQVFSKMRTDHLTLQIKKDELICAFGAKYLKRHQGRQHIERQHIYATSRKMRELASLLMHIKEREPSITDLFHALRPNFFNLFVDATKKLQERDSRRHVKIRTFAMNIVNSLKQCCEIALARLPTETGKSTSTDENNLKEILQEFKTKWKLELFNESECESSLRDLKGITFVLLAEDLKKLKGYLMSEAERSITILREDVHATLAYITLLETIYCRVILLNRTISIDLLNITVEAYLRTDNLKKETTESNVSQILESFKRVTIKGKDGKRIEALFSSDLQKHINELLKVRCYFVAEENSYLFGKPGLTTFITDYKVLEIYSRSSGALYPSALTCKRFQKHVATLSQLFFLNDNDRDHLATFMHHILGGDKDSYKYSEDAHQNAKIAKFLLLLERNLLSTMKCKTLNEIDNKVKENLLETNECSENSRNASEIQEKLPQLTKLNKIRKRTLVPWTNEQKRIVEEYFATHIQRKKPPKRLECEELIEKYHEILHNKEWTKIKVYIQNIYTRL